MSKNDATAKGCGILTLLGIAFIALKLFGFIDWSWVWVLCPFWIQLVIGLVILLIIVKWWKKR